MARQAGVCETPGNRARCCLPVSAHGGQPHKLCEQQLVLRRHAQVRAGCLQD